MFKISTKHMLNPRDNNFTMTRLSILLILFCTIGCTKNKGNVKMWDDFFYKAMLEYKAQEYEKSINNFQKAIKYKSDENVQTYFYAAAAALQLNKKEKAEKFIISAIENTNAQQDYFKRFEEFDKFRDQKLFEKINRNYSRYTSNFYSNLEHPEIYREIDSLQKADQKVRTNGATSKEMIKVDSTNVVRLIEITKKYGWQDKGWIILWHQRGTFNEKNWVWDYFRPLISEKIKEGELRKSYWAQFEEFQNVIENGYQEYGLYPNNFNEYPLVNPKLTDIKRDSVNLPPLWIMNKIYDWPLPDNYEKIKASSKERS
jgi:tetratricopeptide (TPR) repeat protein